MSLGAKEELHVADDGRSAVTPQMRALVCSGMEAGAFGFSTNRNNRHNREDCKPVASRLANNQELLSLCAVLGEMNTGVIETNELVTPGNF